MTQPSSLTVRPVRNKDDLKTFIRIPRLVQNVDPHFISRLDFEMMDHLDKDKNPYFKHAKHEFFIAYDAHNTPIGRISAQIDDLIQEKDEPLIGHFGLLEGQSQIIIKALIRAAEDWLTNKGAQKILGPFSLSINDEMGLLVEGFETPPKIMMNHAPPYYGQALESSGYKKAKDVFAYNLDLEHDFPQSMARRAQEAFKMENIEERCIDMKNFENDLRMILKIFNDAWSDNWGFTPMTEDEITYAASNMRMIIDPALTRIIFINNEPAAMIVALPDLNEITADLNGKLAPFGWIKLLWRLKVARPKGLRVMLMGIQKDLQSGGFSSGIAALLISNIRDAAKSRGYTNAEMSWILEDNRAMNRLIIAGGGEVYKTYRIYEKGLC